MKLKNPFPFRSYIHLLMHTGVGSPYALKISLQKVYSLTIFLSLSLVVLFLGTLLFFRELEVSQILEQRVLELEIQKKLTKDFTLLNQPMVGSNIGTAESPTKAKKKVAPPPADVSYSAIQAKVIGLNLNCQDSNCSVSIGMVPSRSGTAQGKLFLVLETEVQRIGAATHTSGSRTRFIVYPGFQGLDAVETKTLRTMEGKPFKFSNALQSRTNFELGQSLKAIAVDAYVFDLKNKLVSHERKLLETGK